MIFDTYIEINEVELDVKVTYNFSPGRPANLNAPMPECYPAESADIELESVMVFGKDILPTLTPEEKDQIETQSLEHAVNAAIDYDEQKADWDRSQKEQF